MKPHWLADWLLRLLTPRHLRSDVLGDLHEEFQRYELGSVGPWRARLWYWRQVLNVPIHYPIARRRLGGKGGLHRATGATGVLQDLHFAFRTLRRRPLFTSVALLTLALGIGGSTAVFSVVDGVLLRDMPYRDADRVVSLWSASRSQRGQTRLWDQMPFDYQQFLALRAGATLLEDVSVYAAWGSSALTGAGEPKQLSVGHVSASLFAMLGVNPALGRGFLAEEEGFGESPASRVVVLGHEIWLRQFGGDAGILGTTIMLDFEPYEVVGILPPGFRLESKYLTDWERLDEGLRDVWVPIGQAGSRLETRGTRFDVFGRARMGASLAEIIAEAQNILSLSGEGSDHEVRAAIVKDVVTAGYGTPLWLAFGASGLLLAIACANIACLLIGEAMDRRREIATRAALGAGLGRITRHLLAESVLLGFVGAALGALVAEAGLRVVISLGPALPRLEEVSMSWRVLVFAAFAGVGTGVVFGIAPVWLVARQSLNNTMVGGQRGTTRAARSFQGKVVALQIALSAVLLVVSGLFGRSFLKLTEVNPGFETADLAVLRINAPGSRYESDIDATNLFLETTRQLEALPGVRSVSGSQGLPFPGYSHLNSARVVALGEDGWFIARRRSILPDYHETMGIPLVAGRFLSDGIDTDQPREMVISQSLAESRWPSQSPIGELVSFWLEDWTVVGVVADVKHTSLRTVGEPTFYVPLRQTPQRDLAIVVRTERDVTSMLPQLRETVWSVDADLPIEAVSTMNELVAESASTERYRTAMLMGFAALATLIAGAGVFGVTANMVAHRSREIGIRAALGAQRTDIHGMVIRNGLSYALVGSCIGLLVAIWASRLISAYLFGVERWDPFTYATVCGLLIFVATLASYLPARRAAEIDPLSALRSE